VAGVTLAAACALPGEGAPGGKADLDFVVKDMNGVDVRLADYRGRPIVLNFWATWCGPCKAEIPAFIDLASQYKARHLAVLGVSVDDAPDDLRRFAGEYRINYPVLVGRDQDALQHAFDAVEAIPVTWFIRADGTVQLKHKGTATRAWFEEQTRALVATLPEDAR
jgi:peroxiredoxin